MLNDYLPASNSMSNWGTWKVPGMEKAPEFSFYTSSDYANIIEPTNATLQLNAT
jgi:hypothetical protein